MKRREWLTGALLGAKGILLASCGGDVEEGSPSRAETAPSAGANGKAVRELQQITLALLEMPNQFNPRKPSILARELVAEWASGSIRGMPDGTTLQTTGIPIPTDENGVIQATLGVIDFLTSRAAAGTSAGDLVWLPSYADIVTLFKSELFAPLDRWLRAEKQIALDAFAEEARPLVRLRGQTMGLPLAVSPGVLAHNVSRFRIADVAAPTPEWTWDDFIEAGKRLTEDTNDDGVPDRWGFIGNWFFPDWEPLLLQEGGRVVDLDTGRIDMDQPASMRALTAWDEMGRVHGILPYGSHVTEQDLRGWANVPQSGMRFSAFQKNMRDGWSNVTPLPRGPEKTTPLSLEEVLAIPAAASGESANAALVSLAHWIGERRVLPAVTAGWQYIEQPDTDHFDLIFPKPIQDTALQGMANAKASHAASSSVISYWLFHRVTLPLARGEVGVEQAIEQATNWLREYIAD